MAIQDTSKPLMKRSARVLWVVAAILAVFLAVGAVQLLGSIPVFGVKAVDASREMPVEEHPVAPTQ